MTTYEPPFEITDRIVNRVAVISELLGTLRMASRTMSPQLRRVNTIKSVQSSLAIEQNTLSLEQVTAVIEGHRVWGDPVEIREVQNAIRAYELAERLNPLSLKDMLYVHGVMMKNLKPDAGSFRSNNVGVFAGSEVVHMAPPAHLVSDLMQQLIDWYARSSAHPLIKSAIFHYEFEYIHPFSDGNGRTGRLWHNLLVSAWRQELYWIPVEDMVRRRQQAYYDAIQQATMQTNAAPFVEFMLEALLSSLQEFEMSGAELQESSHSKHARVQIQASVQIQALLNVLGTGEASATELMGRLGLANRAHFQKHYLKPALEQGFIAMIMPDKPKSPKQRYRRIY